MTQLLCSEVLLGPIFFTGFQITSAERIFVRGRTFNAVETDIGFVTRVY